MKAVEEHDLSKFTLVELIGYTHRYINDWLHTQVQKLSINLWTMRKDICRWVWGKESGFWKEALAHHYAHNPHHPQNRWLWPFFLFKYFSWFHFELINSWLSLDRIGPMEEHDLEESVVDMMACRYRNISKLSIKWIWWIWWHAGVEIYQNCPSCGALYRMVCIKWGVIGF